MSESRCPHCKAIIAEGQTFCGNCKTKIVWRDGKPSLDASQALGRTGCALMQLTILVPILIVMALIGWACITGSGK